jgi:hypothetical protein
VPVSLVAWITILTLTLDARQPARFVKPALGCSSPADAGRLGSARVGVIDEWHQLRRKPFMLNDLGSEKSGFSLAK